MRIWFEPPETRKIAYIAQEGFDHPESVTEQLTQLEITLLRKRHANQHTTRGLNIFVGDNDHRYVLPTPTRFFQTTKLRIPTKWLWVHLSNHTNNSSGSTRRLGAVYSSHPLDFFARARAGARAAVARTRWYASGICLGACTMVLSPRGKFSWPTSLSTHFAYIHSSVWKSSKSRHNTSTSCLLTTKKQLRCWAWAPNRWLLMNAQNDWETQLEKKRKWSCALGDRVRTRPATDGYLPTTSKLRMSQEQATRSVVGSVWDGRYPEVIQ